MWDGLFKIGSLIFVLFTAISHLHAEKAPRWSLVKDSNNVWWFQNPQGEKLFINAVGMIRPTLQSKADGATTYRSKDFKNGDDAFWAKSTWARVQAKGFRAAGGYTHESMTRQGVPTFVNLDLWAHAWNLSPFSGGWEKDIRATIKKRLQDYPDRSKVIGYYLDNELPWNDSHHGAAFYFNQTNERDPNRQEVFKMIREIWPNVEDFNRDWKTHYESWERLKQIPYEPPLAYSKLYSAWMKRLARAYFETTTRILREEDPGGLVLGVRYQNYADPEIIDAEKDFVDAHSINLYGNDPLMGQSLADVFSASGKPIMISEYSLHAKENESGLKDRFGFRMIEVKDVEERGRGYQALTQKFAKLPYVVGAEWYRWADTSPEDLEDVAYGVVDQQDRDSGVFDSYLKKTAAGLDGHHSESFKNPDAAQPGWRSEFEPSLNLELQAMGGRTIPLRHSGFEKGPVAEPKISISHSERGLHLSLDLSSLDLKEEKEISFIWVSASGQKKCLRLKYSQGSLKNFADTSNPICTKADISENKMKIEKGRSVAGTFQVEVDRSAFEQILNDGGPNLRFQLILYDAKTGREHYFSAPGGAGGYFMTERFGHMAFNDFAAGIGRSPANSRVAQILNITLPSIWPFCK